MSCHSLNLMDRAAGRAFHYRKNAGDSPLLFKKDPNTLLAKGGHIYVCGESTWSKGSTKARVVLTVPKYQTNGPGDQRIELPKGVDKVHDCTYAVPLTGGPNTGAQQFLNENEGDYQGNFKLTPWQKKKRPSRTLLFTFEMDTETSGNGQAQIKVKQMVKANQGQDYDQFQIVCFQDKATDGRPEVDGFTPLRSDFMEFTNSLGQCQYDLSAKKGININSVVFAAKNQNRRGRVLEHIHARLQDNYDTP